MEFETIIITAIIAVAGIRMLASRQKSVRAGVKETPQEMFTKTIYTVQPGIEINPDTHSYTRWKNGKRMYHISFSNNDHMVNNIYSQFLSRPSFATILYGEDGQKIVEINGDGRLLNTYLIDEYDTLIPADEMDSVIANADHVIHHPAIRTFH